MKKLIFIPLMLLSLSAIAYHHSGEELSPIDTVKKAYSTFASGDTEAWAKLHTNDLKFTVHGKLPHSGTHIGTESVIKNVFQVIPVHWPKFQLEMLNIDSVEGKLGTTVYVLHKLTAENLNTYALHMFTLEGNKIKTFSAWDDFDSMRQAMVKN